MTAARALLPPMLALTLGVAACGPVPVDQAERICVQDARAATGPQGQVAVGVASDGRSIRPATRIEMSVGSDYLMGRDPSEVFARCVMRRSGQAPVRPLCEQPGWKG